jgi:hypothetical protein
MTRRITLETVKKSLPYSGKIPYGFAKIVRTECDIRLGPAYHGYNYHRRQFFLNPDANWYCQNMTLYVRNEADLGIITMAVLKKQATK